MYAIRSYYDYVVETGGVELRVSRRNAVSHAESYEIGREVRLGFRDDSVRVLAQ